MHGTVEFIGFLRRSILVGVATLLRLVKGTLLHLHRENIQQKASLIRSYLWENSNGCFVML